MKKYARLRSSNFDKFEEIDNVLYNTRQEISLDDDDDQSRLPAASTSLASGSPQPHSPSNTRPAHATSSSVAPSHTDLTEALKKLASLREGGSRGNSGRWPAGGVNGESGSRSGSGRWGSGVHEGGWGPPDASGSGRWGTADSGSLSGRWGSTASTNDQCDDPHQSTNGNSHSLSRSGRLMQEGGEWFSTGTLSANSQSMQRKTSVREVGVQGRLTAVSEVQRSRESNTIFNGVEGGHHQHLGAAVQRNISMRETQGWLASVKRPQQMRNSSLWEDPNDFNWKASTSFTHQPTSKKASTTQSMRYDRLKTSDLMSPNFDDDLFGQNGNGNYIPHQMSVMQKAASMREGGAHSDAIMAMARAYSDNHGLQPAILECVLCGRGLGVIMHGNLGNDTSFCQSCRPPALGWSYAASKALENGKSKRKGMMHYCKKILRMGKKPSKLKL